MIEQWVRSFKYEEAYLTQYSNIRKARAAIGQYVHAYNFERHHPALDDYQTSVKNAMFTKNSIRKMENWFPKNITAIKRCAEN